MSEDSFWLRFWFMALPALILLFGTICVSSYYASLVDKEFAVECIKYKSAAECEDLLIHI